MKIKIYILVISDGINRYSDAVPGQYFLRRHIERNGTKVHAYIVVDAWKHEEYTRSPWWKEYLLISASKLQYMIF